MLVLAICRSLAPGRWGAASVFVLVSSLILIGSQLALCMVIALFDVLAAPTLIYPDGYNRLCFTPFSVMSAFGVVAAIQILKGWRSVAHPPA